MLTACGVQTVDTGERGLLKRYGKVEGEVLGEGLHFYNPLTSGIETMNVRTLKIEGKTFIYTKDAQGAQVEYAVNLNLDPLKVKQVYQQVGTDWRGKLVSQVVQGSIKDVSGKWIATDLISQRANAAQQIENDIIETLKKNYVVVSRFELTNIDFSDEFEKAVEQKVVAIQHAEKAQNQTVRIQEEAKQKIIAAEADAKAMQIKTEALKQSQSLVEYEAVQKWDGVLPVYMLGNSTPFINIGKK